MCAVRAPRWLFCSARDRSHAMLPCHAGLIGPERGKTKRGESHRRDIKIDKRFLFFSFVNLKKKKKSHTPQLAF
jgi:hypothetical protein